MRCLGQLQYLRKISLLLFLSLFPFQVSLTQGFPEEVVSHFQAGQFQEARGLLDGFRASQPDDPRGLYYAGCLEPDGELSADLLKRSLSSPESFPERATALLRLGQYYLSKSMYLTAASEAERSLESGSARSTEALLLLGTANLASDKAAPAEKSFREMLEDGGERKWEVWANLGLADLCFQRGDYTEAQSRYREILNRHRKSPPYSLALAQFAQCQWELEDPESGERFTKEYLEEFPNGVFAGSLRDLASAGVIRLASEEDRLSPRERARLTSTVYSVQVGAFASKANALGIAQRLKTRGYEVELKTETVNRRRFYKVLVGRFISQERAREVKQTLEAEEGDSFIIVIR
jgi:tetratricopeptide (TPR) repeat protein